MLSEALNRETGLRAEIYRLRGALAEATRAVAPAPESNDVSV
jgi:hypothetical protein